MEMNLAKSLENAVPSVEVRARLDALNMRDGIANDFALYKVIIRPVPRVDIDVSGCDEQAFYLLEGDVLYERIFNCGPLVGVHPYYKIDDRHYYKPPQRPERVAEFGLVIRITG